MSDSPLDRQEGGAHYKALSVQPIEFIQENGFDFCTGNIIKYASRAGSKPGVSAITDLRKVIHYAELKIYYLEKGNEEN